ncbi:MAG TPA: aminotransferase class V-fold PLP-dependent enzyme [Drouetiella sp.]
MDSATNSAHAGLHMDRVKKEFPEEKGCLYLNTGSCGRKPQSVLDALDEGWRNLNVNPTVTTFLDETLLAGAKDSASKLFQISAEDLLMVQNTTQGLQFLMSSFLINNGDEFVTTDSEHGSVNTIAQYLAETRGIVIRRVAVDPLDGLDAFNQKMLEAVNARTKLVLVSEISSYTTWRPNLEVLESSLRERDIPMLVDGAHSGGQIICRPANYRLWVGSGHKWLGGPNGTGFVYVAPDLVHKLQPIWLGDEYFAFKTAMPDKLSRFASQGTTDVVRWKGLAAAINLQLDLGPEKIFQREVELANYLRRAVAKLNPTFRTLAEDQNAALVSMHWNELSVPHLRDHLWSNHQVWVQPDFMNANPGLGVRVSCHYATTEKDLDRFVEILSGVIAR